MKKAAVYLIGILTLLATSCKKDVLDKQPLDIISDAALWKDKILINAFLVQCYSETYVFVNEVPQGGLGWNNWDQGSAKTAWGYINEISDESKSGYDGLGAEFKYRGIDVGGGILEWWEVPYRIIRKLNEFIERVPNSPLDENEKKVLTAEARFLRAYNYFSMVKRYGGVPLITSVQKLDDSYEVLYPKRAKEQEVYDYIIAEIDDFADQLPAVSNGSNYGRPTKYAALALKSRAALYAGSIAENGTVALDGLVGINKVLAKTYYQASYDASELIMKSHHSLYDKYPNNKVQNFRQLFLEKMNPEVIFVKRHNDQNATTANGNGWGYDFFQGPKPNGWGEGSKNAPYLEMAEAFEYVDGRSGKLDRAAIQQGLWAISDLWKGKDPRFFATIYTQGTQWKGTSLDFHRGILKPDGNLQADGSYNGILANGEQYMFTGTGFGVLKYLDESLDTRNGEAIARSSTDWIVFRYGEVLLNFAEAAFSLQKDQEALDAINKIRGRAGISDLLSVDMTKIRHERMVELAFEGHRYWDLRRWRIAVSALSKHSSGLNHVLDYQSRKYKLEIVNEVDGSSNKPNFQSRNYYLPITTSRTGANANLLENPGYRP